MNTILLIVAYDGATYCGFARQPGLPTVQGSIEEALATLLRREIQTTCAGRTDAGVHALGQCVSFAISEDELAQRNLDTFKRSLNALTPDSIAIRALSVKPEGFSARFDAKWREYRYRIVCGSTPPVFLRNYAWWIHCEHLDVDAMQEAAACLIGEHDFKSFCLASSAADKSTCRNIRSIEFFEEDHLGERCIVMRVVGNAFLHTMIRTMIGTLAEVGVGRRDVSWVTAVLAACNRSAAGPCAPAQGLTFWSVSY